jgi:hypothetical protein
LLLLLLLLLLMLILMLMMMRLGAFVRKYDVPELPAHAC